MRILLAIVLLILPGSFSLRAGDKIHLITVESAINPSTTDYIHYSIARAFDEKAVALIVRLNTPGGLLKSTRNIVTDLLEAPLPVIVYVSPAGAQAASAGVFITLAAHVAAMAPGTNIGAAHPVLIGEQMDSVMSEKTTNDAAAFIRSISEKRNRNMRWAEESVRKSLSITETEALRENVIDIVAADVPALLKALDGRVVMIHEHPDTLQTAGVEIVRMEKTFQQEILDIISDPNIAYIFMMLGIYGLMFELYNPGSILPGVVGVISLILAFYSLHTLPVNYAGVGLIIVAIVLFLLEIKIISHGLLTVGGIVALAMGSVMLFERNSLLDVVEVSWEVIITVVLVSVFFFLFVIGMGLKAQRRKPTTGVQGLAGEEGIAIGDLRPDGQVKVHGEIWAAASTGGEILKGEKIIVEKSENLRLVVHRKATT
ncbi:MAG TPA: nodulation protein NfeD [Bacteroidota bacterium]|nr:nodulation protein NfeD [Bacteroidota bacterium]